MGSNGKTYVAGHLGMAGSALVRALDARGEPLLLRSRSELDLTRQADVEAFFGDERIERVYLAAARVGGIKANNEQPADFIRENLQVQTNVIDAAFRSGVSRLLFLGSSCIYPRLAPQPMQEDVLMTGSLEPTNEAYAVAKIAGIKMCESYRRQHGCDFRSVMPTNLYGPNDNFDLQTSHVLPALLRKFHEAVLRKEDVVPVWGTGSDISIAELAERIAAVAGFGGRIEFDASMPDGTPRKLLDVGRLRELGWQATIDLENGLRETYRWMAAHWERIAST
jgi:GDP-L-fucose synthase